MISEDDALLRKCFSRRVGALESDPTPPLKQKAGSISKDKDKVQVKLGTTPVIITLGCLLLPR